MGNHYQVILCDLKKSVFNKTFLLSPSSLSVPSTGSGSELFLCGSGAEVAYVICKRHY